MTFFYLVLKTVFLYKTSSVKSLCNVLSRSLVIPGCGLEVWIIELRTAVSHLKRDGKSNWAIGPPFLLPSHIFLKESRLEQISSLSRSLQKTLSRSSLTWNKAFKGAGYYSNKTGVLSKWLKKLKRMELFQLVCCQALEVSWVLTVCNLFNFS